MLERGGTGDRAPASDPETPAEQPAPTPTPPPPSPPPPPVPPRPEPPSEEDRARRLIQVALSFEADRERALAAQAREAEARRARFEGVALRQVFRADAARPPVVMGAARLAARAVDLYEPRWAGRVLFRLSQCGESALVVSFDLGETPPSLALLRIEHFGGRIETPRGDVEHAPLDVTLNGAPVARELRPWSWTHVTSELEIGPFLRPGQNVLEVRLAPTALSVSQVEALEIVAAAP